MGKKKKIQAPQVTRNPQDFLNDLKFIRKNRDKKASNPDKSANNQNAQQSGTDSNEESPPLDPQAQQKLPEFFKNVQKSIKQKKISKGSQNLNKKIINKNAKKQKEEDVQDQQRWAF